MKLLCLGVLVYVSKRKLFRCFSLSLKSEFNLIFNFDSPYRFTASSNILHLSDYSNGLIKVKGLWK